MFEWWWCRNHAKQKWSSKCSYLSQHGWNLLTQGSKLSSCRYRGEGYSKICGIRPWRIKTRRWQKFIWWNRGMKCRWQNQDSYHQRKYYFACWKWKWYSIELQHIRVVTWQVVVATSHLRYPIFQLIVRTECHVHFSLCQKPGMQVVGPQLVSHHSHLSFLQVGSLQ